MSLLAASLNSVITVAVVVEMDRHRRFCRVPDLVIGYQRTIESGVSGSQTRPEPQSTRDPMTPETKMIGTQLVATASQVPGSVWSWIAASPIRRLPRIQWWCG